MPQVQMPDGTVVEMPDQLDPALAARLRAMTAAQKPSMDDQVPLIDDPFAGLPPLPKGNLESAAADAGDPILEMWRESLPTIVQGAPEALATMGNNSLVMAGTGLAAPLLHPLDADAAADFTNQTLDENLYQPQGAAARELLGGLGEGFDMAPLKRTLGEGTLEATGSPELALGADMLPDTVLAMMGLRPGVAAVERGVRGPGAKLPDPNLAAAETGARGATGMDPIKRSLDSDAVTNLRAGGVKLRPSDVRAMNPDPNVKVPGEFRERFADPAGLKKDFNLENQATLTKRAADELGIEDLTDKSFDAAEAPHISTYEMAEQVARGAKATPEFEAAFNDAVKSAQLPKGEAQGVTRVIGALRRRANKRTASGDVKTEEAGYADRELADRLEDEFGKQLESVGEPQLLQQYRDARKSLAKINDVRGATRADQIDAAALRRMNEKFGGNRLSGGLKFVADAAEYAPNVTGHSLKTASRAGEEMPATKEGILTRGVKGAVRGALKLTGNDVSSKAFQNELGPVNSARSSYYGQPEFEASPLPGPVQGQMDLRDVLGLEPPPGTAAPPRKPARGPAGEQMDSLGSAFEFEAPPGEVAIPDRQIELQEALGLGEPLNLQKSPGRVGKPKRKQ
jgi:hypothetical protein